MPDDTSGDDDKAHPATRADTPPGDVHGSPTPDDLADTRERIRPYIAAGATHIVLSLRAPYPEGIVHRLADEVAAPLAAEA